MAKILVIRLTSIGDVIFTLPLVNILKNNGNEIHYLVSERGREIVENNPAIDKVHFVPLMKWRKDGFSYKEFSNIIKKLREEKFDIALDCQQMLKSLFLFALCGAKRRITFKDARELSVLGGNEFIKPKAKFRDSNYHIVERNLDFARYLGFEPSNISFPLPETEDFKINNIDINKKTIVISPATTWKNKHWNTDNWKILLSELNNKFNIIFTGTNKDIELTEKISEGINSVNLVGKTNLKELLGVFKQADLVISPDSGSSNLAWASGKPAVIVIFTCTPAKRFGPYGNFDKYFSVQGNLSCQPCFKKKCKFKTNACMKAVTPDEIIKIVNTLFN